MGNVKDSMQNFAIQQALKYIEGNPEENIPKLMALVDRFTPEEWYQSQRSGHPPGHRREKQLVSVDFTDL